MKTMFISIMFLFVICTFVHAEESVLSDIKISDKIEYVVRLKNGDLVTGYVIEFVNDQKEGEGIKMRTELGKAVIFANQIVDIILKRDSYRHRHRVFLLPTAMPIEDNHFVGLFELLFVYAGFGISDILSVTAGRSMIPSLASYEQVTVLNGKITAYSTEIKSIARNISLAIGGNLTFINSRNRLIHLYGVASAELKRTTLTASLFTKTGSKDYYLISARENNFDLIYENGAFGIGVGIDTEIPKWHGLHFIGELWNNNIGKPTNTAILLGFRISNTSFSADFGLSFFTQPFLAPFASFVWTPF